MPNESMQPSETRAWAVVDADGGIKVEDIYKGKDCAHSREHGLQRWGRNKPYRVIEVRIVPVEAKDA